MEKFVHWLIFFAIVCGVLGAIVQFIRFGAITQGMSVIE